MKHKRWLAGLAVSALLLGACGSDDDDGGGADTTAAPEGSEAPDSSAAAGGDALTELGEGEGEVNLIAWAGYVEDGTDGPGGRLGDRLRGGDRLQRQRQDRQHLRRDGGAHAERRVRRGVGVR